MENGAIGEMRSDWNRRIFSIASYVGMNITGVKGLNEGTIATLKALGAIEDEEMGGEKLE